MRRILTVRLVAIGLAIASGFCAGSPPAEAQAMVGGTYSPTYRVTIAST